MEVARFVDRTASIIREAHFLYTDVFLPERESVFKKQGMTFKTSSMVKGIKKTKNGASVTIVKADDDSKTETIEAEIVLVAIGVKGRYDGLAEDSLGLKIERDSVWTDQKTSDDPTYETNVPGVYAIGDIIGPPWLALDVFEADDEGA